MKKILIVDDSFEWINFHIQNLKNIFDISKMEIDTAMSAHDGFMELQSTRDYDLIISDLEMEKVFDEKYAGVWLIKQAQLLVNQQHTKIIIISGSSAIKQIAEELEVEFIKKSHLINNPLNFKYLIEEIKKNNIKNP